MTAISKTIIANVDKMDGLYRVVRRRNGTHELVETIAQHLTREDAEDEEEMEDASCGSDADTTYVCIEHE